MFNKFINEISKLGNLNQEDIKFLREHSKIKFYKKNEIINNSVCCSRNIHFILDGCIRLFYNVDGRDKTAFFYNEGHFIWTDKAEQSLSTYKNYEAIEETILVQIEKSILQKLIDTSQNFESIIRKEKEQELLEYQELLALYITLSPEERFIKLLETNNSLFQRVPQQHIATYIGVSAETLCRIKKRVYNKTKSECYC